MIKLTFQHFLNLSAEKQQKIIDASIDEFGQYGYDLASTNRIVEQAGISKGVLFKYFTNKETLFMYISELAAEKVTDALQIGEGDMPDDFFESIKLVAIKEARFYRAHPKIFALFERMAKHPDHPVYQKVLQKYAEKSAHIVGQLVLSLSKSNLRPGISGEQAMTLVTWVADGIKRKFRPGIQDNPAESDIEKLEDEIMNDLDAYFELLKYGIYKRGQTE